MREMQSGPEIRLAKPEEYRTVAALWHTSASQQGVGPPVMPSEEELFIRVETQAATDWHLLIAVEHLQIVGLLALKLAERVLDQLFVCPTRFGTGLGQMLFDRAKKEMPSGFSLHTASTNLRARRFYERQGMVFGGEASHPRTGHSVVYYHFRSGL